MSVKHRGFETRKKPAVQVKNDAIWLKLDCLNSNYLATTFLDFVNWLKRNRGNLPTKLSQWLAHQRIPPASSMARKGNEKRT